MARDGMANLITELRGLTQAGTADYTVTATTYWSDDQLQNILDRHRTDLNRTYLTPEVEYDGGTSIYKDYYAPMGRFEEYTVSGGAAIWSVEDTDGDAVPYANYTVNYGNGHIRFTNDQLGTAYYLRARAYNVHAAAAEVWRQKAGWRSSHVTFTADDQTIKQSDWYRHCMEMARMYDAMSGPQVTRLVRSDLT